MPSRPSPPVGPPARRPLLPTASPALYDIDLNHLATNGWVALPVEPTSADPLHQAFSALFEASAAFLAQTEEHKLQYSSRDSRAYQGSEEGYSRVPGEKCMLTLRRFDTTPSELDLRERAAIAWRAGGALVRDVLRAMEESLGMQEGVLVRTMGPQEEIPTEGEQRVATLMRMFRYDRPRGESTNGDGKDSTAGPSTPKIVAEAHRDLGLLSLVVGHTPGLECWDPSAEKWIACEADGEAEAQGSPRLRATLLVGQTLAKFTNWRYNAGRHRVFVHPPAHHSSNEAAADPLHDPVYRYSLVYAMRAHHPVRVSSSQFTTAVTGPYPRELQFTDVRVGEIYSAISASHWNVNLSTEERKKQEREVAKRAEREWRAAREQDGARRWGPLWALRRGVSSGFWTLKRVVRYAPGSTQV